MTVTKKIHIPPSFLYNDIDLQKKSHILIEFDSPGYGDLVDITPLIHTLLKYDVKKIRIKTNKNDLPLQLIDNNKVEVIPLAHTDSKGYEVINFDNTLKYNINCPTWIRFLIYAGLEELFFFRDPFPGIDLKKEKSIINELGSNYILFHSYNSRREFEGRNTKIENLKLAKKIVEASGFTTFDVGNDNMHPICSHLGGLSHDELFIIIKNSKGFIGIDSYPMHIAALYNKPIFGFFGSTHPFTVLPLFRPITIIQNTSLKCLNCLAINKVESDVVRCSRPHEECKILDPKELKLKCDQFLASINIEIDKTNHHIEYLQYIINMGKSEFELQHSLEAALSKKSITQELQKTLKRVLSPIRYAKS